MQEQRLGKLNIIVAIYGLKNVTAQVSSLVKDGIPQTLNFAVTNRVIGEDGWRGQRKSITIVYNYDGGDLQVATAKEGDIVAINPGTIKTLQPVIEEAAVNKNGFSVLAASYGLDNVTYRVKKMISPYNTLSFRIDNTLFGDPWHGVAKTLVIVLGHANEITAVQIFTEREICYIDLNDVISAV